MMLGLTTEVARNEESEAIPTLTLEELAILEADWPLSDHMMSMVCEAKRYGCRVVKKYSGSEEQD